MSGRRTPIKIRFPFRTPHSALRTPSLVDRLCEELFLAHGARDRDDNLLFVRERLLKSEADLAAVLDLYTQVLRGRRVPDDETNPLVTILRLSGVTRAERPRAPAPSRAVLRVRNRIYARVFDREWVTARMPGAELLRQRAAYRRGVVRATALSGSVLAVMGGLLLFAVDQAHRADARATELRRSRYTIGMTLAQREVEEGNYQSAARRLDTLRPRPGEEDLRDWAWRFLWRRCHGELMTLDVGSDSLVGLVQFLPNGKTLATGHGYRSLKLWDITTGKEIDEIVLQPKSGFGALALSPNGRWLASAGIATRTSGNGPGMSWLRDSGRQNGWPLTLLDRVTRRERVLGWCPGFSGCLAFSPDGQSLAVGIAIRKPPDRPGVVQIWDIAQRRVRSTLRGHTGSVTCLAFSPDGRTLASGSVDRTVRLWDTVTKRSVAVLAGHRGELTSLAFSHNGQRLACGTGMAWERATSGSGEVTLWDNTLRRVAFRLPVQRGSVLGIVWSLDGRTLASCGGDGTVRLWNLDTRRQIARLIGDEGPVYALALSPDGQVLATGAFDGKARLWPVGARQPVDILRAHRDRISALVFAPDGRTLVTVGTEGTIKVCRTAGLHELTRSTIHGGLDVSPTGEEVAVVTGERLSLCNVRTGRVRRLAGCVAGVRAVGFAPNGRTLGFGCGDGSVELCDVSGNHGTRFQAHHLPIRCLALSPDGRQLATSAVDGTLRLWRTGSQPCLVCTYRMPRISLLTFSPDSRTLAVGVDRRLFLWDVATQRTKGLPLAQEERITSIAIASDGRTLATGCGRAGVRLWNLAARQQIASLTGAETGGESIVQFSPDGVTLAAGGADGTLRVWRAASGQETDAGHGTQGSSSKH